MRFQRTSNGSLYDLDFTGGRSRLTYTHHLRGSARSGKGVVRRIFVDGRQRTGFRFIANLYSPPFGGNDWGDHTEVRLRLALRQSFVAEEDLEAAMR